MGTICMGITSGIHSFQDENNSGYISCIHCGEVKMDKTNEYMESMRNELTRARVDFRSQVHKALVDTTRFAEVLVPTIGDVSIAEAKISLIEFFVSQLK